MAEYKVAPFSLESGQSGDAVIADPQSPTGFWAAEWDAEREGAIPLCDESGDYQPAPEDTIAWLKFTQVRDPARLVYEAVVRPAREAYVSACQAARQAFGETDAWEAACDEAQAKFEAACAGPWAAYEAIVEPAWQEYQEYRACVGRGLRELVRAFLRRDATFAELRTEANKPTLAELGTPWAEYYGGSGRLTGRLAEQPVYMYTNTNEVEVAPGWCWVGDMTEDEFQAEFMEGQHDQCHNRSDPDCPHCAKRPAG